jgi:hypothetical protein
MPPGNQWHRITVTIEKVGVEPDGKPGANVSTPTTKCALWELQIFAAAVVLFLPVVMIGLAAVVMHAGPSTWIPTTQLLRGLDVVRLWSVVAALAVAVLGVVFGPHPIQQAVVGFGLVLGSTAAKTTVVQLGPLWASQVFVATGPRVSPFLSLFLISVASATRAAFAPVVVTTTKCL